MDNLNGRHSVVESDTRNRSLKRPYPSKPVTLHCSFDGCTNKHKAHGLCDGHLSQKQRGQTLRPLRKRRFGCKVDGCKRKHYCGGYCSAHYVQMQRNGVVKDIKSTQPRFCEVSQCQNKHYAKGYCRRHYLMDPRPLRVKSEHVKGVCQEADCKLADVEGNFCKQHASEHRIIQQIHRIQSSPRDSDCDDDACTGKHFAKGKCERHYRTAYMRKYRKRKKKRA